MNEAERRLWFASNTDCCQYTLPIVGSNKNPPVGYEAKSGSGRCRCTGNGRGLNSCGELCCDNSPYTSTDPSSSYYFKKGGNGNIFNLCWQHIELNHYNEWWSDGRKGHIDQRKEIANLPIVGSNKNPPVGYEPKEGSGRCMCTGNGRGLNSCGELCCEHSPYTSTDPSSSRYFKKGGNGDFSNLCWQRKMDSTMYVSVHGHHKSCSSMGYEDIRSPVECTKAAKAVW